MKEASNACLCYERERAANSWQCWCGVARYAFRRGLNAIGAHNIVSGMLEENLAVRIECKVIFKVRMNIRLEEVH